LTTKTPIPSIHSTLLSARKDAVNGSGVANDAPWIIDIRVGFPRCGNDRKQCRSGDHRFFHVVILPCEHADMATRLIVVGEVFDLTRKPVSSSGVVDALASGVAFGLCEITV
jgi:hypothetical protein